MRLDILLEPPGPEAESVVLEWLESTGLQLAAGAQVEVNPDRCLEVLVELRRHCFERELTVNVKFTGKENLLYGSS